MLLPAQWSRDSIDAALPPSGGEPVSLVGGQGQALGSEVVLQGAGQRSHRAARPAGAFQQALGMVGVLVAEQPAKCGDHCAGAGPRTANPHLLITRVTASDENQPPVAHTVIEAIFTPLGLTPGQLRRDRIPDEARHTADPVHLMTVFRITAKTAMTYVQAAHPERRPTLPR